MSLPTGPSLRRLPCRQSLQQLITPSSTWPTWEGETVLLHTASGGVGLVAIQIARELRLNIICTAGRKRAYLRSHGIQHVLHSRNTHYEKAILQATQGKGVAVVLNSLTGAGFKEATLGACAHGARFVEMSRLNIWTEEEVRARRPDVDYTIVDITTLDHATHQQLTFTLRQWIREGRLNPIPYTRFDTVDVRQALNFLQKARHVGKVVCTFPTIELGVSLAKEGRSQLFNRQSTYLITGGLGGIGLEVCKYMLERGARHIVLLGRKSPNSQTAALLSSLRIKWDCDIRVMQADIGVLSECLEIFTKIADTLPPLRGVMHVAGTLSDDLLKNLTWDSFQFTYQAKVNGSWNLHETTKNLILEHFVLFSSFASTLGSPGQANYTSACQFQDGFAHFRNIHGLPATTINWGQFGEVGLVAGANLPLVREFSPQQGINALDEILRKNRNHITPVAFNSSADFHINMFPLTKWLFGDLLQKLFGKGKLSPGGTGSKVDHNQFSKDYDGCKNTGEKIDVMETTLREALIHVLRLNTEEAVDPNMDFDEMGMDSLMMIEFQNFLQDILKGRVTLVQSAWADCTTVNSLGKRLVELMEGHSESPSEAPPTLEQVRELILKDAVLPEGLQVDNPGSEVRPSQIKTVLLTGSTGFMGSHLLTELLGSCPHLERIYCLVRKRQKISPEERLLSVLEKNGLPFNQNQFDKLVIPVVGNFTEPHFGLEEAFYLKLAKEVDAVIHFAAQVNQTEYYRDIPGGKTGARSVNVGGLLNVLEFGCRTRTKHIFNASTLAALLQPVEGADHFPEEWPNISYLAVATTSGYFASQYVCDALLKEATTRLGIPCKSFRYSRAMGDLILESSLSDQSLFTKLLIFSLKEKVMPERPIPVNIIPVGIAVKITTKMIFSDEAPNDIYNVFHPRPHLLQECLEMIASEMGVFMTRIDHYEGRDKYIKILQQRQEQPNSSQPTEVLAQFENFFSDDNLFSFFSYANVLAEKFVRNQDFFVSGKLARFASELYCEMEPSFGILKRYMDKVREEGLI